MQRNWTYPAIVIALTLVAVVRVASTHRVFSATVDEPIHLASGYEWFRGELTTDMTHPPLARVLGALPLRLTGLPYPKPAGMVDRGNQLLYFHAEGREWRVVHHDYVKRLARVRKGNLLLLVVAIATLAAWARRVFPREVAAVAVLFFSTHPLLLGHAGLLTTDLAVAATLPLALLTLDRYLEARTLPRALILGVAAGLGALSKFSFFVFFPPCAIALLLLRNREQGDARPAPGGRVTGIAIAMIVAFLTIWAGYRFHVARPADVVAHGDEMLAWAAPLPLEPLARFAGGLPLPAPELFVGMAQVKLHEIYGHTAYLLGHESRDGWWYYFPVVLFYKSPLPWLFFAACGIVVLRRHRQAWMFAATAAAILLLAMTTSLNIGARHILPMVGPLSIVAAAAVVHFWRTTRDAFGRAVLAALLVWNFAGPALEHPDYLAWFNELARPERSWFAADSNVDWGQDVLRLSRAVEELQISHMHVAFMNSTRLPAHGINASPLVPHQAVSGWVAVSENYLRFGEAGGDYAWLRNYRPVRQIGASIRLYFIP